MKKKINNCNCRIEQSLNIVKYQRELQVLLTEIKDRSVRTNELLKRCQNCAKQVSILKPLVKKELIELTVEERKESNKLLRELHLKI